MSVAHSALNMETKHWRSVLAWLLAALVPRHSGCHIDDPAVPESVDLAALLGAWTKPEVPG